MQCSISGVPPKEPVVSPKSGAIFERSLVEAYINEHHKDPVTSDELSVEDLITIRASPYQLPRNATLNSVPSLLSALQNEWDAVALELFQLRKQLDDSRKELSTALYHHDAAVRVASRAIKERDEARKALQDLTTSISGGEAIDVDNENNGGSHDTEMPDEPSVITAETSEAINAASQELFAIHKAENKINKPNVAIEASFNDMKKDDVSGRPFKSIGITAQTPDKCICITSAAGAFTLFNAAEKTFQKIQTGLPKSVKVTTAMKTETLLAFGSSLGHVWINHLHSKLHDSAVIKLLQHPSLSNLVFSVEEAGIASLWSSKTSKQEFKTTVSDTAHDADIHPDGALACVGSKDTLFLIDLRTGELTGKYKDPECNEPVISVKFGSNGYWLFASYSNGEKHYILVWDLRKDTFAKINTNFATDKVLLDKSSQLIVALSAQNLETFQFVKASKSWVAKGSFASGEEDPLVDGVIVDDSQPNELSVAVVTKTSHAKIFKLSA